MSVHTMRNLLLLAPPMRLEEGTQAADPAMQHADGVLVEAQGHGYVLGCSMKSVGVWCKWQWDLKRGLTCGAVTATKDRPSWQLVGWTLTVAVSMYYY